MSADKCECRAYVKACTASDAVEDLGEELVLEDLSSAGVIKDQAVEVLLFLGICFLVCNNFASRSVYVYEDEVNLTAREFDLLELFMKNPNQVYTRERLLELIWGSSFTEDARTVDVHIRRLREKIEKTPGNPMYVKTKWGVGYYLA